MLLDLMTGAYFNNFHFQQLTINCASTFSVLLILYPLKQSSRLQCCEFNAAFLCCINSFISCCIGVQMTKKKT